MRRLQLLFVWALMLFCGVQVAKAQKVAMLIAANSESELPDDDEIAAVNWFKETYGDDGVVLTPNDVDKLNPTAYKALWIQIDRVGIGYGVNNLPACITADNVIAQLKNYIKQGGNVLLTKHATQLIVPMGRLESKFAPGIFGDGEGGEGSDIWTTNAFIGSSEGKTKYDHRGHDIFMGMDVLPANDPVDNYDHESYPLEGPGFREDHNCMWDLSAYGLPSLVPTAENVVDAFQTYNNAVVLATWGHVTDYCCAGIVEFNPTSEIQGKVIAIGLGAYEFKQNSGTNQYQGNIEKLTSNSLDYLIGNTLASTKAPITVDGKASYWGTFYSSKAKTLPTGVTAYIVSSATNKSAKLTKVAETGQVIPGENGYLLSTEEKQDEMYLTDADANQAVEISDENLLMGSDEKTTVSDANYTYYILGKQGDNYGFYWQPNSEDGSKVTNAAHKAYLQIQKATDGSEAKFLSFTFGDGTTSIKGIATEQAQQDATLYNLAGQRINNGYKGLVIKNGNKYMTK